MIVVVLGGPGYVVATMMVFGLRLWLGAKGQGWPRILVNSLLGLLAALACVYGIVFFNALLPPSDTRATWTRGILAVGLSVLPYCIIFPLGSWWIVGRDIRRPVEIPTPLTPHIPPDDQGSL